MTTAVAIYAYYGIRNSWQEQNAYFPQIDILWINLGIVRKILSALKTQQNPAYR